MRQSKRSKESAFLAWFEAQFGKEPSPGVSRADLDKELVLAQRALMIARERLHAKDRWSDDYRAARYAWNAKGKT